MTVTENERREREAFEAEYRKRFMVPAATPLKFPDVQRAREWFQAGRASLSASTPSAEARDAARLDFLEAQARKSRTGVSLDWCKYAEDGYVQERGYRVMWFHTQNERKATLRDAIDLAMGTQPTEGAGHE